MSDNLGQMRPLNLLVALMAWFSVQIEAVGQTNEYPKNLPEWEDPWVFGINKLPPRCPAWACPDVASGWKSSYDYSPWVRTLDGQWQFHWAPDPSMRPTN